MMFSKISLSIIIFSIFLSASTANGLRSINTSPINRKVDQRKSSSGGTRSECQSNVIKDSLTLLVPDEKIVHQTATDNPSFLLYSKVSTRTIFTLVDPDVAEPLVEKLLIIDQPGYHQVDLPQSVHLKANKTYSWHIAIYCLNDSENYREILGAAVKYVPLSPKILTQLRLTKSLEEIAIIYAKEGMWYDAINFANRAYSESPSSRYWQQLLTEIGLSGNQEAYHK